MSMKSTRFRRSLVQAKRFYFDNPNWEPPKAQGRDSSIALSLIIPTSKVGSPGRRKKMIAVQDRESGGLAFKPSRGIPSALPSSLPAKPETQARMRKWASK